MVDRDLILRKVADFRILVPDYARLDPTLVVRALTTNIEDVRRFRELILTIR